MQAHLLGIKVWIECPKAALGPAAVVGREVALEQCEARVGPGGLADEHLVALGGLNEAHDAASLAVVLRCL